MAAADGIRQYWQALDAHSELVIFDYLDAQKVWQRYFTDLGAVQFHGKNSYIAFMQAVMMDGVKGTALIGYLGEMYKAGTQPTATAGKVATALGKKAAMGIAEFKAQINGLKSASLSVPWLNSLKYTCPVFSMMKSGQEISPSDLG